MRFKVLHLLIALTFVAFGAMMVKQVLTEKQPFDDDLLIACVVALLAMAIGVVSGFSAQDTGDGAVSRRRLIPFTVAVVVVNLGALLTQQFSLKCLRHSDLELPPVITLFFYLEDVKLFLVSTIAILTSLAWGFFAGRVSVIRLTAAISLAFWLLVFALGYLGAAVTTVPLIGPLP